MRRAVQRQKGLAVRRSMVLALLALCACAVLLSACGGNTVSKGEIAKQVRTGFAKAGFRAPVKSVTCPKDLDAKTGKSERCTLTYQSGHALEVTATIKRVSGSTAHFSFVVTKRLR
jgi:ABC-type uncharacterized transport system auxiliary subunit